MTVYDSGLCARCCPRPCLGNWEPWGSTLPAASGSYLESRASGRQGPSHVCWVSLPGGSQAGGGLVPPPWSLGMAASSWLASWRCKRREALGTCSGVGPSGGCPHTRGDFAGAGGRPCAPVPGRALPYSLSSFLLRARGSEAMFGKECDDRGDKNIIFTEYSLFKISGRLVLLFLNRPESPLENAQRV